MKIKELSQRTGIPIPTIRYYEQIHCISPSKKGYYKIYTEEIEENLIVLKKLQAAGLALKEIQGLFTIDKDIKELTPNEIKSVRITLQNALDKIEQQEALLFHSKEILKHMIKKMEFFHETSQ